MKMMWGELQFARGFSRARRAAGAAKAARELKLAPLFLYSLSAFCAASPFTFRDLSPASLELRENGEPVFVYNHGPLLKEGVKEEYRRSSYLHPVYAPGGIVITDDFPKDHPHHRGLFWAWPIVKFEGQTYDVWAVRGMHQRFVRWIARKALPDRAILTFENGWFTGERKAVKETVELTVFRAASLRRQFEVRLTLEAVGAPVEISGREEKGYGGFGLRFAPRTESVLRSEAGVEPKDTDLVRHPWAELEGVFEGRRAGARIENDPTNPASPPAWCLRHYGYIAPNFPGVEAITLHRGRPLKLSYHVTVFSRAAR